MSVFSKGRTYYTKKEYEQLKVDIELYNKEPAEEFLKRPAGLLLDSSLIVTTNNLSNYNIKVILCNDYVQVYKISDSKIKTDNSLEISNHSMKKDIIKKIDTDSLKSSTSNQLHSIETKNIIRSKLQCQRLAKANAKDWKTFITLTFAENIKDVGIANKKFRYFIDQVQRKFKELKYICIPEFQKRGAVHYHLLTNIPIDNPNLIYSQVGNEKFKHVKHWNEGFTSVDSLDNDIKKIIGYISKYMTKDIDNRLYNRHRYFYSRNLGKPKVSYLDLDNIKHQEYLKKLLNKKELIYTNKYQNSYNEEEVIFEEYL